MAFSVPPQHQKTESSLHAIAYWLSRNPKLRIVYASYNQRIAERKAMKAQAYCESQGVKSDPRMANRADWVTQQGGGIIARGRDTGVTGEPGDIILVDDLFKNRQEAESPTIRGAAWDFFTDVVQTRTHEGSSVFVFFTRWHEDDLIGRIIKDLPEFEVLRIPALADHLNATGTAPAPDPLGRELGEPLLPRQKSKESLEYIRDNPATSRTFNSLYQGLPKSDVTRIFAGAHYYTELPTHGYEVVCAMDGAYTESTAADNSVFGTGRMYGGKLYLEYVYAAQTTADKFGRSIRPRAGRYPVKWRGSGTEKGVAQLLGSREFGLNMDFLPTSQNKLANNTAAAAAWNEGKILLPDPRYFDNDWLEPLTEEAWKFTGIKDPHDDYVDFLGNLVWKTALEVPEPETIRRTQSFSFQTM